MLFTLVVYRLVRLHGCYVNGAWVGVGEPLILRQAQDEGLLQYAGCTTCNPAPPSP
jgi:hypothetical protein